MKTLQFFRYPLIVFIAGAIIRVIGVLMKVMHWPGADMTILIATIVLVAGLLWAMMKLFVMKKTEY